jgi:hypothetical protein
MNQELEFILDVLSLMCCAVIIVWVLYLVAILDEFLRRKP